MILSKGLENEFETTVVNESSVFEPLKLYCMFQSKHLINKRATISSFF